MSSRVVTAICVVGGIAAVGRLALQNRAPAAPIAAEQGRAAAAAAANTSSVEIATTVAFTEGPAVDRDGNVYFTEIINQRIMKLGADGVLSTYREPSNVANGMLIDPQGRSSRRTRPRAARA